MPANRVADGEAPENSTHPTRASSWRRWLEKHHTRTQGVWLISFKQATGRPRVGYAHAVEEALCFGWIDSLPRKLDSERSMLWFAPRKPRSAWSRLNKQRVARLLAEGRMHESGMAKVQAAKRDGSWNALDAVEDLHVAPDLARAFRLHPGSRANFDGFPPSARKGILSWIASAKRAETRAQRILETARSAARGIRANQWRP